MAEYLNRYRPRIRGIAVLALFLLVPGLSAVPVRTANADTAAAKAVVDAAKARGVVGEQGDGYLGLVHGTADSSVTAAVAEINSGRAALYRDIAGRSGVTPAAAGEAAAQQIFSRMPPGQYYKPIGGRWTQK